MTRFVLVALLSFASLGWKLKTADETATEILGCYHPTATFKETDFQEDLIKALETIGDRPSGMVTIGESNIYYEGLSKRKYRMRVAHQFKWRKNGDLYDYWMRFPVLSDTAAAPRDSNCYFANWVPLTF